MTYYGRRSANPLSEGASYETIRNDKEGRLFVLRRGGAAVTGLRRSGAAEPERRLRANPSASKARAKKRPRAGFQTRYRQHGTQIQTRTTVGSSGTRSPGPDKYFYQEALKRAAAACPLFSCPPVLSPLRERAEAYTTFLRNGVCFLHGTNQH